MTKNVFTIVKEYINRNSTFGYGDIGKDDVQIKNMCNKKEYSDYEKLQKETKKRFITENANTIPNNYLMGNTKSGEKVTVGGIGEVRYIC